MITRPSPRRQGFVWVVLAAAALVVSAGARESRASEAKGDLNLQLRLIETVPVRGSSGPSMTGLARIELLVDAFRQAREVQVAVERPDGTSWTFNGRPFNLRPDDWTDPGGEPLEPDGSGPVVPARGAIRTTIQVPLNGAMIHGIVVRVTALIGDETVTTEAYLTAALGVAPNLPVDDGTFATFSLQEVK